MRFVIPVQQMKLLEIVRGRETGEATVKAAAEVGRRIGKETVVGSTIRAIQSRKDEIPAKHMTQRSQPSFSKRPKLLSGSE